MNEDIRTIQVLCVCDNIGIPGACVSLINSEGKTTQELCTNHLGCVSLPIACVDNYRIRVQVPNGYTPKGQNRWAYMTVNNNYSCSFIFKDLYAKKKTGTLKVILKDANYSEYLLEKREITLWLGLK